VNRKLLSTILVLSVISISFPLSFADTAIVGPADTICKERTDGCDVVEIINPQTLRDLLDSLGIPQCDEVDIPSALCNAISSEDISQAFEVLANPPEDFETEAEIEFEVVQDTGAFFYSYGFCHTDSVGILDPITQKEAWATACLGDSDTVEVFDDTFDDVGDTKIVLLDVGDELFFWLIPNNDLATFNADPSLFYPPQTTDNEFRAPLFSVENANPGEFDQFLTFIGGGKTLFTVEDLSRDGSSDEDFTDLAFVLDVELDPKPFCELFPLDIQCIGGELISIDTTSLLVAGATSSIAWYMYAFTALGIGAFWFARNPYNVRNVKTIIGDYLDRFSKTD